MFDHTGKLTLAANILPLHRKTQNDDKAKTTTSPVEKVRGPVKPLCQSVMEKMASSKSLSSAEQQQSSPVRLLKELFARNGQAIPAPLSSERFQRPDKEVMEAYDMETCRAVRAGDMDRIRRLHKEGKSLNGSNQFGESLLHMACRRGNKAVVQFMLQEANVRTNVRDDMGRNVFHDAFWTSKPNLDVMDVLLESISPELLLAPDIRGHTPFDYSRKAHWNVWCKFLQDRKELLQRRLAIIHSIEGDSR